jgi:RimJ/RimL family protein N-acetyltransferase
MIYILKTARIGFRFWASDDLPLAIGLWGDPQVTRFITNPRQLSEEEAQERLSREIATAQACAVQYWPIFLLSDGEHLGCAGLRPYKLSEGIYEIGVHLRPQHWGRGHATEAARAVISYAFDQISAKALFAGHHPKNESSRALLAKLGFRYTHDELYEPTGLYHPSYLLTAEEFDQSRRGSQPSRPEPLANMSSAYGLSRFRLIATLARESAMPQRANIEL